MKLLYVGLLILCFGLGVYAWKFSHPGHRRIQPEPERSTQVMDAAGVLVQVGADAVTQADLDWEFQLHTHGLGDREELTPIPDVGANQEQMLNPLKERLLSEIVERKMLFAFIGADTEFARDDPARFIDCTREYQDIIGANPELFRDQNDQERLRERLCQRSVLQQYMAERLFTDVGINEEEVQEYYINHQSEFDLPERVVIRQVVVPSEREAKRVRAKLRRGNFAEMAKEYSITPEAEQGGILGPYARGEMPRIFDIAFRMRRGQISDIQKSKYGFHLLMLEEKHDAKKVSLEEATAQIESTIRREKEEVLYRQWLDQALATISVKSPKPLW